MTITVGWIVSSCSPSEEQQSSAKEQPVKSATTKFTPTSEDILGQWKSVVKNPAHRNSVSRRYMRHSFSPDDILVIEDKVDSISTKKWTFDGEIFVINSSFSTSEFIEHYKLNTKDELIKIRFKSIIDGKPLADYNPDEQFVRQGSQTDISMNTIDSFETSGSATEFIDPTDLAVGSRYVVSKKTPVMPHFNPSNLNDIFHLKKTQSFKILDRKKIRQFWWYQVKVNSREGWINSIALYGQKLKQ